jgi:hypothetical protein
VVGFTPHFPKPHPHKDPIVPIEYEAVRVPEPVWYEEEKIWKKTLPVIEPRFLDRPKYGEKYEQS